MNSFIHKITISSIAIYPKSKWLLFFVALYCHRKCYVYSRKNYSLKEGFIATAGSDFLARILPNNVVQVRDYCDGIEYFESKLEAVYFANGRVKYDDSSSEREYVINDYQGNIRILFRGKNGTAEEIENYSYYAFGAIHEQQSDYNQKYLFGGKELQTELDLGWSDFGTRCFDTWKARWEGIDIMSEATPQASPYGYTLGNPIRFSDPTGMLTEENGLITTSTSLLGRDASGGENTGEILNSNFISTGQLARDTYTYSNGEGKDPVIHNGGDLPAAEVTAKGNAISNGTTNSSSTVAAAAMAITFIKADIAVPEGTDGAWPKWAAYAATAAVSGAILYYASDNDTGTGTKPVTVTTPSSDVFHYVTYLKTNPSNGFVYVGRSSGFGTPANIVKRRDYDHHMTTKGYGTAILSTFATATIPGGYAVRAADPAYWAIRGSEQIQIEAYRKAKISGNSINGIGSGNPNLQKYLKAAKNVLTK